MQLVANRDINEGDELTIAYVDISIHDDEGPEEAFDRRHRELKTGWGFDCICSKCAEEGKTLGSAKASAADPAEENAATTIAVEQKVEKEPHSMEGSDVITVEQEEESEAGQA